MRRFPNWRRWLRRPFVIAVLGVIVVLVLIRATLPMFVTRFVNDTLNGMDGYQGRIEDVDLHIWRGAYSIYAIRIDQIIDGKPVPVLRVPAAELSVEWRALFRGALVGKIALYQPRASIYAGPAKEEQARGIDDLVERVRRLLPFQINRFSIADGRLHFRNFRAEPDIDIYLDQVQVVAYNLTNSEELSDTLWATVNGEGRAMKSGEFRLRMQLDPLAKRPTFRAAFDFKNLHLPELNDFLKHYLSVEARDGRFSFYAESIANEGNFKGYVKPVVRDLDILRIKKEDKSFTEAIKGFFVKIFSSILENKPANQLATRIEFSGSFEDPEISVWNAVVEFLRNAFVQALPAGLEGSVAPRQVEQGRPASGR